MFSERGPRQMKRKPRSRWSGVNVGSSSATEGTGNGAPNVRGSLEVPDEPVRDRRRQVGEDQRHQPVDRLAPAIASLVRRRRG